MQASNLWFALTGQTGYGKSGYGEKPGGNRRNGKPAKTLSTDRGPMGIAVPRDRDGGFEPAIVPKRQRERRGFGGKILAVYSRGMATAGIRETVKEIYNAGISPELASRVTGERRGRRKNGGTARLRRSTRLFSLMPCV